MRASYPRTAKSQPLCSASPLALTRQFPVHPYGENLRLTCALARSKPIAKHFAKELQTLLRFVAAVRMTAPAIKVLLIEDVPKYARLMKEMLEQPVHLDLRVKVLEKWRSDERLMKRFGYHIPKIAISNKVGFIPPLP